MCDVRYCSPSGPQSLYDIEYTMCDVRKSELCACNEVEEQILPLTKCNVYNFFSKTPLGAFESLLIVLSKGAMCPQMSKDIFNKLD